MTRTSRTSSFDPLEVEMTDVILVLATAPSEEMAAKLAKALVDEELAACGNILPGVRSIHRWKGKVEDEQEVILLLKTRADLFEALKERLVEQHPYDCPEVLRLPVEAGHLPYLEWVRESVRR